MLSVDIFLCFVFVFIGFLVISTNICSLVILRRHWCVFEEVPRFLYQYIGLIDIIGGLSGCTYYILYLVDSGCRHPRELNRFLSSTYYFGYFFSGITISCLNIDRYIAISKPLRYPSIVNIRSVLSFFALSTGFVLLYVILVQVPGFPAYKLYRIQENYMCGNGTMLGPDVTSSEKATIVTLSFLSTLPIYIGITLNLISMGIATRQARAIAALPVPRGAGENNAGHLRIEFKGVKTVLFISVVNLISLVPTLVRLFFMIMISSLMSKTADVLLTMLTLVNFWSNAFIFAGPMQSIDVQPKTAFDQSFAPKTNCGLLTTFCGTWE